MLPDKDELNNEIIEQISGGDSYTRLRDPIQGANQTQEVEIKHAIALPPAGTIEGSNISPNCGMPYLAVQPRTDGCCPNCEPQITPKIAPVGGDLKTTVPNISDKDKLVKIL